MSKKVLSESRTNDGFMKIYDASDEKNFKLVIESNVLKKYKFTINITGNKISIVGKYEEKCDGATNVQSMSYECGLPSDVDPNDVKTTESDRDIRIEAPRKK